MAFLSKILFENAFLWVLLVGIALLILLRLIPRVIGMLRVKPGTRRLLRRGFPAVEALTWAIFIFWALGQFWGDNPFNNTLLAGVFLFLVIISGWFALRDFSAGIILKTEDAFEPGQYIRLKDWEGHILHAGHRSLAIETGTGEKVKIPYSCIAGQERSLSIPSESSRSNVLHLFYPKKLPADEAAEHLRRAILNTPWASATREPRIKLTSENKTDYFFEAIIYSSNEKNWEKITAHLKLHTGVDIKRHFEKPA